MKSYRCYDIFLYLMPSLTHHAYFQYVILFIFSLASFVTLISKTFAPSGRFQRVTVTQSKHSFEIDGSI